MKELIAIQTGNVHFGFFSVYQGNVSNLAVSNETDDEKVQSRFFMTD
jgi:hypothetical protein